MPKGIAIARTQEERIAEVDKKIEYHKNLIAVLEKKREGILNPTPRGAKKRVGIATLAKIAKEQNVDINKALEALKDAGLIK